MPDQKGTIIELTEEQKEQMRRATGAQHEAIKVENVGSQLAPRITPSGAGRRLAMKGNVKAGARVNAKLATKAATKGGIGRKVSPKLAAKQSPKLATKQSPKLATKQSPKLASKKATKS